MPQRAIRYAGLSAGRHASNNCSRQSESNASPDTAPSEAGRYSGRGSVQEVTTRFSRSATILPYRQYRGLPTHTATGLVRTGTQWTKRHRQIIENPLNKRNFRTHQDELEREQANS